MVGTPIFFFEMIHPFGTPNVEPSFCKARLHEELMLYMVGTILFPMESEQRSSLLAYIIVNSRFVLTLPSMKLTNCPGKMMVGKLLSFLEGLFSGENCSFPGM